MAYDMFDYSYGNLENSGFFPSVVHADDNKLTQYNFKYLFKRALSVFDFNIPNKWDRNFFLTALYSIGYLIIIDTPEFGVIPQVGNIWGYNVFYQPAKATVMNPVFDEMGISDRYRDMVIGDRCELLRLTTDYTGIIDICRYYAELIATAETSLQTNLINSKMAFVFLAKKKSFAESLKKLYDEIASGSPAVFADKDLVDENGNSLATMLQNNVRETYIGTELLDNIRTILNNFDSMVGIPNGNLNKRERMITDELNANNFETRALCYVWRDQLRQDMQRINDRFNLDLSVDFRKESAPDANVSIDIDPDTL